MTRIVLSAAATYVVGVSLVDRWHHNRDTGIGRREIYIVKTVCRPGYRPKREPVSCDLGKDATTRRDVREAHAAIVAGREILHADVLVSATGSLFALLRAGRRRLRRFFPGTRFCLLRFAGSSLLHLLHGASGCSTGCLFRSTF